jgi:hypothetical protein
MEVTMKSKAFEDVAFREWKLLKKKGPQEW